MRAPAISVLLCVYNPDREQLCQAVDSIIGQTYIDWEMVLYDDGSDKKYAAEIYQISCKDVRIRYIRNEDHHSLAYGLNESLKLAMGKYIARMDADDISYPERFAKQLAFLSRNPQYMWVGSNIAVIDEKGNVWGERHYPAMPESRDFLRYSPYAHPSIMFRRKAFAKYGKYKSGERACRGEDYELLMRFYALGGKGFNLQEPLLQYRETKKSYRKRTLYFQLQEVRIRFQGFRRLGLLTPKTFIYVIKPIIVWMLPDKAVYAIRKKQGQFGRSACETIQ
ncbi:MAG: glycosyltransferase [Clostridium sp.]|nr:glycosyltransferase [Clostridium sp.]